MPGHGKRAPPQNTHVPANWLYLPPPRPPQVTKALWITFTPLLWPVYFLCKWCAATCVVSKVVIM